MIDWRYLSMALKRGLRCVSVGEGRMGHSLWGQLEEPKCRILSFVRAYVLVESVRKESFFNRSI